MTNKYWEDDKPIIRGTRNPLGVPALCHESCWLSLETEVQTGGVSRPRSIIKFNCEGSGGLQAVHTDSQGQTVCISCQLHVG